MTTVALISRLDPAVQEELAAAHPELRLVDVSQRRDELVALAGDAEVAYGRVRPHELAEMPALRWIQASWAGVENLIADGVGARDIVVTNVRGQRATAMAEHAVAGLLHLLRDFPAHAAAQARGEWRTAIRCRLLADAHVVVLGTGGIGRAVIDRLLALGTTLTAINRTGEPVPGCERTATAADLPRVLRGTTDVVVTVPATDETRGLVDASFLAALESGANLVNVSRGSVVDEAALLAALDAEQLAGAVLDVTDPEPPSAESPLWSHPRVLLTGHQSGAPRSDHAETAPVVFAHNLACWLRGDRDAMRNVVDTAIGY